MYFFILISISIIPFSHSLCEIHYFPQTPSESLTSLYETMMDNNNIPGERVYYVGGFSSHDSLELMEIGPSAHLILMPGVDMSRFCSLDNMDIHNIVTNNLELLDPVTAFGKIDNYYGDYTKLCNKNFALHKKVKAIGYSDGPVYIHGNADISTIKQLYDSSKINNKKIYYDVYNFISIGERPLSVAYQCSKTFPINDANLVQFKKHLNLNIKFSLYGSDCIDDDGMYNFIYSFGPAFKNIYHYRNDLTCKQFKDDIQLIQRIFSNGYDIKFPKNIGWNKISQYNFLSGDYTVLEAILHVNYGFKLSRETFYNPYTTVYFKDSTKSLPICVGICFYANYLEGKHAETVFAIHKMTKTIHNDFETMFTAMDMKAGYSMGEIQRKKKIKDEIHEKECASNKASNPRLWTSMLESVTNPLFTTCSNTLGLCMFGHNVIDVLGRTWQLYTYKGGAMTVEHADPLLSISTIANRLEEHFVTERNTDKDFRVYGVRPKIGKVTKEISYSDGIHKYKGTYIGSDRRFFYFISYAKAISGLSGAPVYNSHGEFLTLYSQSLSFFRTTYLRAAGTLEGAYHSVPCILRCPIIDENSLDLDVQEIMDKIPVQAERVTMEEDLPESAGYFELTAPLGCGKSTKYPLSLHNKYGRILLVEPYIGLARQIASKLGFGSIAGGVDTLGIKTSKVVTAGYLCQKIKDFNTKYFQEFEAVLIDEAHLETADILTVKRWFKENAAGYGIKCIAMSATHPGSVAKGSNYNIQDVRVSCVHDLEGKIDNSSNILFFSPTIENRDIESFCKKNKFKVIKYNSKSIEKDPDLPSKIFSMTQSTKGIAIIATKVADVGFNANIDAVFSTNEDLNTTIEYIEDKLVTTLNKRNITLPTYIQRRGRVGRMKPGIFFYAGTIPTEFDDTFLVEHFLADLRNAIMGSTPTLAETTIFMQSILPSDWNRVLDFVWKFTWEFDHETILRKYPLKSISQYNPFKTSGESLLETDWDSLGRRDPQQQEIEKNSSLPITFVDILWWILPSFVLSFFTRVTPLSYPISKAKGDNITVEGEKFNLDEDSINLKLYTFNKKYQFEIQTEHYKARIAFFKGKPDASPIIPATELVCNFKHRERYLYEDPKYYVYLLSIS